MPPESLPSPLRERIKSIVDSGDVVVFMKGTKAMPQCGFSATVAQILNEVGVDYEAFNILADQEVREGIKVYGDWPTLPQLYIRGELVGGCDIVKEMFAKGDLHESLGLPRPQPITPVITLTPSAAGALKEARESAEDPWLRLSIDGGFRHNLYFDKRQQGDVEVQLDELSVVVDPMTSRRADGLTIDFIDGPDGSGFKIDNPNAPR